MCKNNPKAILAGLALCFFGIQSSQAASILVTPSDGSVALGSTITLTLSAESFPTEGTPGGGINISWDPSILTLNDLGDVDTSLFPGSKDGVDNAQTSLTSGNLENLNLLSFTVFPTTPAFDIATITFMATGAGSTTIDLELGTFSDNGFNNDWINAVTATNIMPTFLDGSVTVTGGTTPPPAVPVPPALLLFGSGLIGLGSIARRKKNTLS